jgi:UDP-N-acetylmuramyl pentapeptide phosphotransferase/UDP-N-acetylglucosamine-1-phosphate transferase
LTTGGIKALTGFVLAFLTSRHFSQDYLSLAVNALLLALAINALNLLDLRPGRAIKVFLLGFLLLFWKYGLLVEQGWILVMVGASLSYAPLDFRGKVMLGDTGSNLLGFALGYSLVALIPLYTKAFLLMLLVLLHWYSERYSLTEFIARVSILDFFDRLGRPEV